MRIRSGRPAGRLRRRNGQPVGRWWWIDRCCCVKMQQINVGLSVHHQRRVRTVSLQPKSSRQSISCNIRSRKRRFQRKPTLQIFPCRRIGFFTEKKKSAPLTCSFFSIFIPPAAYLLSTHCWNHSGRNIPHIADHNQRCCICCNIMSQSDDSKRIDSDDIPASYSGPT